MEKAALRTEMPDVKLLSTCLFPMRLNYENLPRRNNPRVLGYKITDPALFLPSKCPYNIHAN